MDTVIKAPSPAATTDGSSDEYLPFNPSASAEEGTYFKPESDEHSIGEDEDDEGKVAGRNGFKYPESRVSINQDGRP